MMMSLHIDPAKCTGCLQCELACSYDNEGVFNPAKSRIKVFNFHDEGRFVPYTCTQCAEAWCLQACPVDAISVDIKTGAKVVSDATCSLEPAERLRGSASRDYLTRVSHPSPPSVHGPPAIDISITLPSTRIVRSPGWSVHRSGACPAITPSAPS